MIKSKRYFSSILISILLSSIFVFFMIFLSPRFLFLGEFYSARDMAVSSVRSFKVPEITSLHRWLLASSLFLIEGLFATVIVKYVYRRIQIREYKKIFNKICEDFIEDLRFCYTQADLIKAIGDVLEGKADASSIIFDKSGQIIYNSTSSFTSSADTFRTLKEVASTLKDGVYFFNDFYKSSKQKNARMVDFCLNNTHIFIIWRAIKDVDAEVFPILFAELKSFIKRAGILSNLIYLSELSQEWKQVSETQLSFLPRYIPNIKGLDIGVCFKPLVNVSGDYYVFIEISTTKTLLVLGDVSGKGLAAALVMGVIVNTIKIAKDKEDLRELIYLIDAAIKRMNLMDKYTVLFLGIVDTGAMSLKYVNASIEDPMIFTKSPEGLRVKTLDSTCSIVGIIDIDELDVVEKPLYNGDVILLQSDGVPEAMNSEGVELGETDFYLDKIKSFAKEQKAQDMVDSIANMALDYAHGRKMRDDVTIVACRINVGKEVYGV